MYNVSSKQAEEFIDHQEILDTLDYARTNKDNRALKSLSDTILYPHMLCRTQIFYHLFTHFVSRSSARQYNPACRRC